MVTRRSLSVKALLNTELAVGSSSSFLLRLLLAPPAEVSSAEPLRVVRRHVAEVSDDVLERLVVSCGAAAEVKAEVTAPY